jgi:hypothetical protein
MTPSCVLFVEMLAERVRAAARVGFAIRGSPFEPRFGDRSRSGGGRSDDLGRGLELCITAFISQFCYRAVKVGWMINHIYSNVGSVAFVVDQVVPKAIKPTCDFRSLQWTELRASE